MAWSRTPGSSDAGAPSVPVVAAVVAAGVALLFLVLGPVAWWATPAKHLAGKEKVDARNSTRQVLLAGLGGLGLLAGATFTARTYYLTRRGQLTERYAKAVTQLASDKRVERLGGVYALEYVMVESANQHDTVCSVLAAFVRDRSRTPAEATGATPDGTTAPPGVPGPDEAGTDVRAAVMVLGRRPVRPERVPIDLTGAHLPGTDLAGARFGGAILRAANLTGADLSDAELTGADLRRVEAKGADLTRVRASLARLRGAGLSGATLVGADLSGANLSAADLTDVRAAGADLRHTVLRGVSLEGADLGDADVTDATMDGTNLREADLSRVVGLGPEQLRHARRDGSTTLPGPDGEGGR